MKLETRTKWRRRYDRFVYDLIRSAGESGYRSPWKVGSKWDNALLRLMEARLVYFESQSPRYACSDRSEAALENGLYKLTVLGKYNRP